MSPIAISLDLLLAGLMLVALVVGWRLNRRLKALRDSQASFARSVADLNEAAGRAEAGLASLRAASEEAHDALLTRIETARSLIAKLDTASLRAEQAALASAPTSVLAPARREAQPRETKPGDANPAPGATRNILADLAARAGRTEDVPPAPAFAPLPPAPHPVKPSSRPAVDDELFEGDSSTPTPHPASSSAARTWDGPPKGDRR